MSCSQHDQLCPIGQHAQLVSYRSAYSNYVLQVRIRSFVQGQRHPVAYNYGPWTEFIPVQGLATVVPTTEPLLFENTPDGVFLVLLVVIPVGCLMVIAIIIIFIAYCSCWFRKK